MQLVILTLAALAAKAAAGSSGVIKRAADADANNGDLGREGKIRQITFLRRPLATLSSVNLMNMLLGNSIFSFSYFVKVDIEQSLM